MIAGRKARTRRINSALSDEVIRAFGSWNDLVDRAEELLADYSSRLTQPSRALHRDEQAFRRDQE